MKWILILSIFNYDGVSSQQIPMEEISCKHYEQQYNSGRNNRSVDSPNKASTPYISYAAQCLNTGLPK